MFMTLYTSGNVLKLSAVRGCVSHVVCAYVSARCMLSLLHVLSKPSRTTFAEEENDISWAVSDMALSPPASTGSRPSNLSFC